MSTIDGLKVHVPAAELQEHLMRRVAAHSEKADHYAKRYAADKELIEEEMLPDSYSNSARKALMDKETAHRSRATGFKFMADHLVEGVTYILDNNDLATIEIVDRGW